MTRLNIEPADDPATVIRAFAAELSDPAKPLSLIVQFTVEAGGGDEVEAAFCPGETSDFERTRMPGL
jgi:hypothetical protein